MSRDSERLVRLMYAAEICEEREEARRIVTEAYMMGHVAGVSSKNHEENNEHR